MSYDIGSPDYSKFSVEDLTEEKTQVELDIAKISAQLDKAQAEIYETGKPSNPQWLASAKSAKRYKGFQHQQILKEFSVRGRAQREAKQKAIDRAFVDAAKSILDADKFHEILQKAQFMIF